MSDSAPQVTPPAATVPSDPPAPIEPVATLSPPAVPEPVASANELAPPTLPGPAGDEKEKEKQEELAKEKEAHENAATEAIVPLPAPSDLDPATPLARTFTTHDGKTVTVAELPEATNIEDKPATVPLADHTAETATELSADSRHVKRQDFAARASRRETVSVPRRASNDSSASAVTPTAAPSVATPRSIATSCRQPLASKVSWHTLADIEERDLADSSPELELSSINGKIGIFPQYMADAEMIVNVQHNFSEIGTISLTFGCEHRPYSFTLNRRLGSFEDKELRDMSRMFIFGLHKRRFRRPRQ